MSITHDQPGSPETDGNQKNSILKPVDEDVVMADLEGTGIAPEDISDRAHLPVMAPETEADTEGDDRANPETDTDEDDNNKDGDEAPYYERTAARRRNPRQWFAELSPLKRGFSGGLAIGILAAGAYGLGTQNDSGPKKVTPDTTISEGPSLGGELTPAETAAALSHTIEAYESQNGQLPLLVDDEIINTYTHPKYADTTQNLVHLAPLTLPVEAEINEQTAADLFNENVAYDLGRYMSLVANNDPSAIPVIQNEFSIFVGKGNERVTNLQASLEQVVATYGSAIYTVLPASLDNKEGTVFTNGAVIDNVNADGVPTIFSDKANVVIDIQKFDKDGKETHVRAIIKGLTIVYERIAPTGPAELDDPGDISMGAKDLAASIEDIPFPSE